MSAAAGPKPWAANCTPDVASFAFSEANRIEVDKAIARYPAGRQASAVLPLLHIAQAQHGGWLPRAALDHVADLLGMARIKVYEIATFYDMYNTEPTGRIQVRVCTTTPCWLCGSDAVLKACKDALGIDVGETTADGRFSCASSNVSPPARMRPCCGSTTTSMKISMARRRRPSSRP